MISTSAARGCNNTAATKNVTETKTVVVTPAQQPNVVQETTTTTTTVQQQPQPIYYTQVSYASFSSVSWIELSFMSTFKEFPSSSSIRGPLNLSMPSRPLNRSFTLNPHRVVSSTSTPQASNPMLSMQPLLERTLMDLLSKYELATASVFLCQTAISICRTRIQ